MPPENIRDQAAQLALSLVIEDLQQRYCPSKELIRTVARFNSEFAAFLRKHGLGCQPDGSVFSAGCPVLPGPEAS